MSYKKRLQGDVKGIKRIFPEAKNNLEIFSYFVKGM
jgi:hypothetical protein